MNSVSFNIRRGVRRLPRETGVYGDVYVSVMLVIEFVRGLGQRALQERLR